MTETLTALVTKFRARAAQNVGYPCRLLAQCADELEAALAPTDAGEVGFLQTIVENFSGTTRNAIMAAHTAALAAARAEGVKAERARILKAVDYLVTQDKDGIGIYYSGKRVMASAISDAITGGPANG